MAAILDGGKTSFRNFDRPQKFGVFPNTTKPKPVTMALEDDNGGI